MLSGPQLHVTQAAKRSEWVIPKQLIINNYSSLSLSLNQLESEISIPVQTLKGLLYATRIWLFQVNSVQKSLLSAFTNTQKAPVEFISKRDQTKFHQGALSKHFLGVIFASIAFKLENVGPSVLNPIHVHLCHRQQQTTGNSFNTDLTTAGPVCLEFPINQTKKCFSVMKRQQIA